MYAFALRMPATHRIREAVPVGIEYSFSFSKFFSPWERRI